MASEPIEEESSLRRELSPERGPEYRERGRERRIRSDGSPLGRTLSRVERQHSHSPDRLTTELTREGTRAPNLPDLEKQYTRQGYKIVTFEPGTGEDPREWSNGKKWYITGTTAFLCLAVALGSSIVTGDIEAPVKALHSTQEIINLSVTCFVYGFGIGPIFFAPLSEVIGRKPAYTIAMFFFFIFTLPGALAKNAATLVVTRQIAGLAASAPMCNVGGSIADIWSVEQRGIPMAVFSGTIFLGPCLGPLIGSWIGQRAGWRWIYWVLFFFTGGATVLTFLIPETLAPVLLSRKAAKLRKETGDQSYTTLEEKERLSFLKTLQIAMTRPLIMMVMEPIVLFMSFYLSFVYSLLYLLFFAFPIAFAEIRHFGLGITGTTFCSIMLGIIIALALMPFQERLYSKVTRDGTFPEARLYPMMLGSIVLPIALFIFAFTGAYHWVHWMGTLVSGAVFGFAMIFIYVSANSYIVDSYSNFAASAIAAKTLMRSLAGGTVPLFVNQMFHKMRFQFAGLLLALVSIVIMPMPFVFYKFGGRIRMRSERATKAQRGEGISEKDVAH